MMVNIGAHILHIDKFRGPFRFLSNFHSSPFIHTGITYPTVEHFFQAMKTLSLAERITVASANTPGDAKRLGRQVRLRRDWDQVKIDVMSYGLRMKFMDQELAQKLISTGNAVLTEGNEWHDNFWGVCSCNKCKGITGANMLGRLLMLVRGEISYYGGRKF